MRNDTEKVGSIKLRKPPVNLAVRGVMDAWAVKETFIDQFYARYGEPVQNGWVVVDIGAGMGDYSIYAAIGNPETKVYAFEPFPSSYDLLIQNLNKNKIGNVIPFQQAVWSRDGQLTLDLSSGEPLQISSTEDANIHVSLESVSVEAVSLESMLQREVLSHIDLLKLDCEGAEFEILMGAAPKVLTRIQRIIMEYHDIDAKHHHSILENFLESQGFSVKHHHNFVHDNIGYLYGEQRRKNE